LSDGRGFVAFADLLYGYAIGQIARVPELEHHGKKLKRIAHPVYFELTEAGWKFTSLDNINE